MQNAKEFRKKFDYIYYNKLLSILRPFEEKRKDVLINIAISIILAIILLFLFSPVYRYSHILLSNIFPTLPYKSISNIAEFIVSIQGIAFVLLLIYPSITAKIFEDSIKQDVMPILSENIPSFEWSQEKFISDDFIKKSKLFENFNTESNDDNFKGNYKNADIKIRETELEREIGFEKGNSYTSSFKGVLIALLPQKNTTD